MATISKNQFFAGLREGLGRVWGAFRGLWEGFGEHLGGFGEGLGRVLAGFGNGFGGCFARIFYSTSLAFVQLSLPGVLGTGRTDVCCFLFL